MLRNGHVSVTCGADQQPPAFIFMRRRINDSLLGAVDNHRYIPFYMVMDICECPSLPEDYQVIETRLAGI